MPEEGKTGFGLLRQAPVALQVADQASDTLAMGQVGQSTVEY